MQIEVDGQLYDVVIERKSNKNTYIRVKDDMKVHVSTNIFTSDRAIQKLIRESYYSISKMINNQLTKNKNNDGFFYLGKKYKIVYMDTKFRISDNVVYMRRDFDIDKWYRKEAKKIFSEHLIDNYNKFSRSIPKPSLRIRKMTTRWGVCNIKTHVITLNLELIKRDIKYLDYVINHELSHLVYGDHSNKFWNLVGENCSYYKECRKEMKDF